MKILLVGAQGVTRAQVEQALRDVGHDVHTALDVQSALHVLNEARPQLTLLVQEGAPEASLETVRLLRSLGPKQPAWLLRVVTAAPEDLLVQACDLGADAAVRMPVHLAYLKARVRAAGRFLRLPDPVSPTKSAPTAGAGLQGVLVPETAAAADAVDALARSSTWRTLPSTLQSAASCFLTLPVYVSRAEGQAMPLGVCCAIVLANPTSQLEMRVAVGADVTSARALVTHLFGPDEGDLAADVLNELSNIFMGALKASFGSESVPFTGGLPAPLPVDELLRPPVMYRQQDTFSLVMGDAQLVVHVGLRSRANILVTPGVLIEGMVTAKAVHNARGVLMAAGGTRLSSHMIGQLRTLLAPTQKIEVTAQ